MNCDALISTAQEKLGRINRLMDSIIQQGSADAEADPATRETLAKQLDRALGLAGDALSRSWESTLIQV